MMSLDDLDLNSRVAWITFKYNREACEKRSPCVMFQEMGSPLIL